MCQSADSKGLKKHPRTRGLKQRGRGTYDKDKPPIITITERGTRNTIFTVEKNLSKQLIHKKIEKHCEGPVEAFTDDYTIYINLEEHLLIKEHHVINHSDKEYAEGEKHVNNAENKYSLSRPCLNIFKGVSKKNLHSYVKFFQFTFNNGINRLKKLLIVLNYCTLKRDER